MVVKKKKTATKKPSAKQSIDAVFGTAVSTGPKKKSKSKSSNATEVEMDEGFESYVALILVEKALDGVKKQLEGQYKETAYQSFVDAITRTGKKPESIVGVNGDATALFQYKKRGAGFTLEVANALEKEGIPYEQIEVVPERFTINPDLISDQVKLGKLAEAIQKLNLGFDVIQKQEPVFKYNIVEYNTVSALAKLKDPVIQAELIKAVSSVAVAQAKIAGCDAKSGALGAALQILKDSGIL